MPGVVSDEVLERAEHFMGGGQDADAGSLWEAGQLAAEAVYNAGVIIGPDWHTYL